MIFRHSRSCREITHGAASVRNMDTRHLLILDLDETLVHATRVPLQRDPDALIPPYVLYLRPGVEAFLKPLGECYRLAIWTSSSPMYARVVSEILFPDPEVLEFVWARDRCTPRRDFELDIWWDSKPLHKVRRRGYDLRRGGGSDAKTPKNIRAAMAISSLWHRSPVIRSTMNYRIWQRIWRNWRASLMFAGSKSANGAGECWLNEAATERFQLAAVDLRFTVGDQLS